MIQRDVAQMVARLVWDQDVAGSNPVIPTKKEGKALAVFPSFLLNGGENLLLRQQIRFTFTA